MYVCKLYIYIYNNLVIKLYKSWPKRLSSHKAILVITRRAHCFHNCICVMPILLLQDLESLCAVDTYIKLRLNFEKLSCEKFCL